MPLPPSSTVLDPGKPAVAKTADDINDLFKDLDVDVEDLYGTGAVDEESSNM